jgi:hypothetical protein
MVAMPISSSDLAQRAKDFADSIEEAKPRWLYCLGRVRHNFDWRGETFTGYSERACKASVRILGARSRPSPFRYGQIEKLGYEGAVEAVSRHWYSAGTFDVGPLEAWHIGHVYIARVTTHPHVVKIGFSRRVRDRLEDVESKHHTSLTVPASHLKVGTMLDEHWWHNNWRKTRISGEWFFDPHMADRTLPDFLVEERQAA